MSQLIEFWAKHLQRIPSVSLASAKIPASSKKFLAEVGLPRKLKTASQCFEIRLGNDRKGLLRLNDSGDRIQGLSADEQSKLWKIGMIADCPLCLDERKNGAVVSILPENGSIERLNSSVEQFVTFLWLYEKSMAECRAVFRALADEVKVERLHQDLFAKLEKHLRENDPSAFAKSDDWWAIIIEQIKSGER